jgi:hypothetical protein
MAMSSAARPAPVRRWPAALAWALAGLAVLALAPAIWLARLLEAAGLADADIPAGAAVAVALAIVSAAAVGALLAGAGSLVGRFRRARGVERQQLRWLALAAGCASVLLLAALVAGYLGKDPLVLACLTLSVALLPLATGAAILRYRLYDLDRIISRTVAYGLLTVLLGLGYTALVLGLGQLLGRDTPLVVAAATLAVAVVFQPARRRVQAAVDRRFNRRRYDAAQTIQAFSARLRQQVDLDTLTGELLAVVEQTMQPTRASLWLRPTQEAAGQAGDGVGVRRASSAATNAAPSRATPSR